MPVRPSGRWFTGRHLRTQRLSSRRRDDRLVGVAMAGATKAEMLADGLHFGEGPRWHDGRLWLSDFYDHAVKTVGLDGMVDIVLEVANQPSGLGWLPDGRLLVVSMIDRRVLRLDPDGLVEHADLSSIATYHCNDMVVDATGRAFVGNFAFDLDGFISDRGIDALFAPPGPPRASLARIDPDGAVHVAAEDLQFPNGSVVTPDGRTLIVAESLGRRLTAFDLGDDGTLSNRRVWADLGERLPDGIALDAAGRVWVANPVAPECFLVAEGGEVVDVVETDQPCFACMLGGQDGRQLFMLTAASSLAERASVERTGHVMVATVGTPHAGLP
jgi:sugar lactone lactonase YvrE